jgi:hypothetical protein
VSYGIYSYNPIFNFFILFYLKKQKEKFWEKMIKKNT